MWRKLQKQCSREGARQTFILSCLSSYSSSSHPFPLLLRGIFSWEGIDDRLFSCQRMEGKWEPLLSFCLWSVSLILLPFLVLVFSLSENECGLERKTSEGETSLIWRSWCTDRFEESEGQVFDSFPISSESSWREREIERKSVDNIHTPSPKVSGYVRHTDRKPLIRIRTSFATHLCQWRS